MNKKAWLNRILLIGIILIFLGTLRGDVTRPFIAITSTTIIMLYLVISGITERRKEVNRIIENNLKHWSYKSISFDWSNLVNVILLFFVQAKMGGTLKYMMLIQGILLLALFCYNTFIIAGSSQHLLAVEENRIINIQHKVEEINLSKFKSLGQSENIISFKRGWRKIKIRKEDFINSDNLLETIKSQLDLGV